LLAIRLIANGFYNLSDYKLVIVAH